MLVVETAVQPCSVLSLPISNRLFVLILLMQFYVRRCGTCVDACHGFVMASQFATTVWL